MPEVIPLIPGRFEEEPPESNLEWDGYFRGKKYVYRVAAEALARSPGRQANAPNPPLPARTAMERAEEFATRVLIDDARDRRVLQELMLVPTPQKDKWLWVAYYEYFRKGEGGGTPPWAYAIVLMDGTVVEPKVIDDLR